jgi:hypothetical protein
MLRILSANNDYVPHGFKNRLDLSRHATPRPLRETPIHNWFVFPHSYSHVLVETLMDDWGLTAESRIYDPFVGAGTTLLAAKSRGIPAVGADISPLSVFVANAKVAPYRPDMLSQTWEKIQRAMRQLPLPRHLERPPFLEKALELGTHQHLERIRRAIVQEADSVSKQFFLLALLRVLPHYSRALPDGGWFRWRRVRASAATTSLRFASIVERMLADVQPTNGKQTCGHWRTYKHDARIPLKGFGQFDALITSPPYPNRHDYTRIFTTELLFLFLGERQLKKLRYQNLRSHVEARPMHTPRREWNPPRGLRLILEELSDAHDKRVPRMIRGYFEDLHLTLAASKQLVKRGGHLAFVVGNVQHLGVQVPVDSLLANLGEEVGLRWKDTWVIRLRGNSAQQMGRYGRTPSRESIVILTRP